MLFLYALIALAAIAALIFSVPLRAKVWAALGVTSIAAVWCSALAVGVLADGGTLPLWSVETMAFGAETGSMDTLSALFVLIISFTSVSTLLYSKGYVGGYLDSKSPAHVSLHYTALTVMCLAMLGVVLCDGGYTFLFAWELMTIASFILILFDAQRKEVLRAALTYLILMHVGFAMLLVGFVRLDAACGSASFAAMARCFAGGNPLPLAVVFLVGFGMKAGLFPMHVWLPEAHPAAPSHVSAIMSGVMIKTGVYGILRVAAAMPAADAGETFGVVVLVAGIVTGLWGVILAAIQNDAKRLLAYSSIENVGVIMIGLGVALLGRAAGSHTIAVCGVCGALLHTLNHSLFKSLLFFGAGNVYSRLHTTSLDALGGVAKYMPVTAILFAAATAAICALPPLNGFVSEFLIYLGILDGISSQTGVMLSAAAMIGLAMIGGMVVLAFTKLYGVVFLGSPRSHEVAEHAAEVDSLRIAAMAMPAAGILCVGLFPQGAFALVSRAAGFFFGGEAPQAPAVVSTLGRVCLAAWVLVAVVLLLAWLRCRALRGRTVASGETWGCGFTAANIRMQYTGESFSEGLESVAESLTQNTVEGRAVDKSEIFPTEHSFKVRHKDRVDSLMAEWWMESLRIINARMMRLRTGKINHYVAFALLLLVLVFALSILNLL